MLSLVVLVLRIMGFKECYSFSDNLFYELSLLSIYECWVIRNKKLVECCEKVNEILSESNPVISSSNLRNCLQSSNKIDQSMKPKPMIILEREGSKKCEI